MSINLHTQEQAVAHIEAAIAGLRIEVKTAGGAYGSQNLLKAGQHIKVLFEPFHHRYQELIYYLKEHFHTATTLYKVSEEERGNKAEMQQLSGRIADAEVEHKKAEGAYQRMPKPVGTWRIRLIWLGTALLSLFESILCISIIEHIAGLSHGMAVIASLPFAAVLLCMAAVTPRIIGIGRSRQWQRIIAGGWVLFITCFFWALGELRAGQIVSEAKVAGCEDCDDVSVLPIVFFSLGLFLVSAALHYFFMPDRAAIAYRREYAETGKKKEALKAELDTLTDARKRQAKEHSERKYSKAEHLETALHLQNRIITAAKTGYADFKTGYMAFSGTMPLGMEEDQYPFTFDLGFQQTAAEGQHSELA